MLYPHIKELYDLRKIEELIQSSDLDQTIKDIMIRDLAADGLSDFLIEQINTFILGVDKVA